MARDPKRVISIINCLERILEQHPDMRLGQLLVAATQQAGITNAEVGFDIFYVEDDAMETALLQLENTLAPENKDPK